MKNKFRSYGFWTALAGAVVVLINAIGQAFGFNVDNELVTNIIMAIAGVLVVFGVVSMPKNKEDQADNKTDEQDLQVDKDQEQEDNEDNLEK